MYILFITHQTTKLLSVDWRGGRISRVGVVALWSIPVSVGIHSLSYVLTLLGHILCVYVNVPDEGIYLSTHKLLLIIYNKC